MPWPGGTQSCSPFPPSRGSGSAPPMSHDDHAQLVPKVLHLVDLDKRPRVVDLIQALDHVGLIAEGEGHKGTWEQVLALQGSLGLRGRRRETPEPARAEKRSHFLEPGSPAECLPARGCRDQGLLHPSGQLLPSQQ